MKCPNCGVELDEGSRFCAECGAEITEKESVDYAESPVQQVVYCPNCGKAFTEGEIFCDECGSSLQIDAQPSQEEAKTPGLVPKKWNKKSLIIPVVVVAAGLGVFGVLNLAGGKSGGEVPTKLVYYQENSMMLTDLKNRKAEPVEITDSCMQYSDNYSNRGIVYDNAVSKDEKYIFYYEDYDGNVYDLYQVSAVKPKDPKKIDSNVSYSRVLENNTVLYMKRGDLYYYNGKDSVKIAKNVMEYEFGVDKDIKNIYWAEWIEGKGETYYYQDLAQKKEAVKLDTEVNGFYPNSSLTRFYVLKESGLYTVDNAGNKEKITKNIDSLLSIDPDAGEMYYIKNEPIEVAYKEFIYDDTNSMNRMEETNTVDSWELYYYGKNGEQMLTDRCYPDYISYDGKICLYKEYLPFDQIRVNWSDFNNEYGSSIHSVMADNTLSKLAVNGNGVGTYEDLNFSGSVYDKDSEKLYISSQDYEEEEGSIYMIPLEGKAAGHLTEYDSDAYRCQMQFATEKGLYYLKDYKNYNGDLFFNGSMVAADVYRVVGVDKNQLMMYMSDYDDRDQTFEVSLGTDKKTRVATDVNYAECAKDGTVVFLTDYDMDRGEGDLMYYDGKKLRKIDEDVKGFGVRRNSTAGY